MLKILLGILAVVVIAVTSLLAYASTRPTDYRVERSLVIAAEPSVVFALVNDFARWPQWSPWAKLDPQMKNEISTPSSGVGAKNSWKGEKAGSGQQVITQSDPAKSVHIDLAFLEPFESKSKVDFTFTPEGNGTKVVWGMNGKSESIVEKAFGIFVNMDEMLGKDFTAGLAAMKTVAEVEQQNHAALPTALP
jgi:ribosome-associated toxin RatA of RatAB toxin-antitoxin module